jgi:hydrogenase maturation protease
MSQRILIAGIGNIFLQDDGFGVEVVKRLAGESLPDWVRVKDFGIRGVHLAYEILDGGYDTTILIDAAPRGEEPGTVYLIEPNMETVDTREPLSLDAHGMNPNMVFEVLKSLGATRGRVYIVGCEPLETEEGIGLSTSVARGVEDALKLVHNVIERLSAGNFDGKLEVKDCKQVSR